MATAQTLMGFNYGATTDSGACQDQASFTNLFNRANSLPGASGFTSARLYTTVQCGTANTPTSAIQAAMDTGTKLLLGMWASAGSAAFQNEIAALTSAIKQYPGLADNVVGISVGSEDLYRSSPQGVANNAGVGADAATIMGYIAQVRQAISGTSLDSKPIGHVDTWTAWVLPENTGVTKAVDWLGHNSFPYFETTHANGIEQGAADFNSALTATESVSGGRPVWVTETGWPHSGTQSGQAVASVANAETYWKSVGCSLFGNRNTWWYTLEDADTAPTDVSFGITPSGSNTPIFDLSCSGASVSTSQSSAQSSTQSPAQSSAQSSMQSSAQSSAQSSMESTMQSSFQSTSQSSIPSIIQSTAQTSAQSSSSILISQSPTEMTSQFSMHSASATSSPSNPISASTEQTSSPSVSDTIVPINSGSSTSVIAPSTVSSTVMSTASTSIASTSSSESTISSPSESSSATGSPTAVGTSNKATKIHNGSILFLAAAIAVLIILQTS
ncbi:MAG: hypothetical protein GOMPHAMPRED_005043 [Gomphillus americanus]|uniref:Probable glucan endo-1,3-beta-glucosidase eglC n=1 Tax=Gomphillus americanus TaxID=1940652 RepID=A0A8H3EN99_9LECA|nr:MAG: hypothetical protein GOMPHAMPRED_005043 [Gomphillus americanus]